MYKKILFAAITAIGISTASSAQTLFTYGPYKADAKEFLRAFHKNNTQPLNNKAKAINDYLDLYIKSRLKIKEAYTRGYDTLSQIKMEVANLRSQIADNYMNDQEMSRRLIEEAFNRSQKDIHIGSIFISFKDGNGVADNNAATPKKDEILKRLAKGEDFLTVAQQSSDDPAAKTNKGDLGFITVFSLPYEFENAIYATAPGKYSPVVTSKIGYHIFKNIGERKALGKIRAQQILLAIPPGADAAMQKQIAGKADSLYKKIIAGGDFNNLASTFSNDYISAANNGIMPDISVGQYDPAFEKVLWSLPKDGAVSKPFLTSHGWHILKRIALLPVVTDPKNKKNEEELRVLVSTDSRWKVSDNFINDKVIAKVGLQRKAYNDTALFALADTLLDGKKATIQPLDPATVLFSIGNSSYKAQDFIDYSRNNRYKTDGSNTLFDVEQLRENYIKAELRNYYKEHLEDFNEEFRTQMTEFKDGNLFFEIMQQEIWNKAQTDSAGLQVLYNKNKSSYTWKQSADAVVFFCSDAGVAKQLYEQLKKTPADWRNLSDQYAEKVIADSSRYEWTQLPNLNKSIPVAGMITTPLVNKTDNTASFAYVIKAYPQPMQRTFSEARGLVINDYQTLLEDKWTAELKKKYPVVVDQKVLSNISK